MTSTEPPDPRWEARPHACPAALAALLRDLRSRPAGGASPTPLPAGPATDLREITGDADAVKRFVVEATNAGCRVHAATPADWCAVVATVLQTCAARQVLLEPQANTALTPQRADTLRAVLTADGVETFTASDDETLFRVAAAITGVSAAIAETGTLVCASGPGSARGASLIPPVHVAVLATHQIVADLFDYFRQLSGQATLPANVNLITGPSKTADIEGILVTGVHGPGAVHVVLLDEQV